MSNRKIKNNGRKISFKPFLKSIPFFLFFISPALLLFSFTGCSNDSISIKSITVKKLNSLKVYEKNIIINAQLPEYSYNTLKKGPVVINSGKNSHHFGSLSKTQNDENFNILKECFYKNFISSIYGAMDEYKKTANSISNSQENIAVAGISNDFALNLINLINNSRNSKNLASLNLNATLSNIANNRSSDMISRNYFSHITPEGKNIYNILQENNIAYMAAGENMYYSSPPGIASPESAFSYWMSSDMHRGNILSNSFTQVGIGISSNETRLVIVLVFLV